MIIVNSCFLAAMFDSYCNIFVIVKSKTQTTDCNNNIKSCLAY